MPRDLPEQIGNTLVGFCQFVEENLAQWQQAQDPISVRAMEQAIAAAGRQVAYQLTALVLQHIAANRALQARAALAARQQGAYRSGGLREVQVTLLGGSQVVVRAEYLKADRRHSKGRKRRKRGPGGSGWYPLLCALGIGLGVSPAVAAEVSAQAADSDSLRSAKSALERRGLGMGLGRLQRIVNQFSARAVEQREHWLEQMRSQEAGPGPLSGKRIVISADGGRLRERRAARQGRRREGTGRRRYDAPWREPKLFTIYVLGPKGTVDPKVLPVYDATLGDCEQLFSMLLGYLKALGAHQAEQVIFVADGAKWIWERTGPLAQQLGLPPERVVEVIDWCHAVSVLYGIANARVGWAQTRREHWVRCAKRWLHEGNLNALLGSIDALSVGRRAKAISQHRDYFARNVARMQYACFREAKVPIGSGTVESAVRRVVNMRLKSNGMFWLEASAEGMLLLRSYLKAGHFDALVDWSLCATVPWWHFEGRPCSPLSFPSQVAS